MATGYTSLLLPKAMPPTPGDFGAENNLLGCVLPYWGRLYCWLRAPNVIQMDPPT